MQKRTKNHHIVPQVLQKQFSKNQKNLWFSKRDSNGNFHEPEYRNIQKIFRKKDYYTVLNGEKPSDIFEREFYGDIDNYLGKVLPKISEILQDGNTPTFSGSQLYNLKQVIMQMVKRTPDYEKKSNDIEMGKTYVKSILEEKGKTTENIDFKKYEEELKSPLKLKEYGRDIRVRATILNSPKIDKALEDFSVHWSVCKTKHSYILASKMVYWLGNGGPNGFVNPKVEIWMPISPKVSLILFRDKQNQNTMKHIDNREHIRAVNEYAMQNSDQIASDSKELLDSLIEKSAKDNYVSETN